MRLPVSCSDWCDEDGLNHARSVSLIVPIPMTSLTLHLLTIVIAVLFLFFGHLKLTGQFFPDYHTQVKNEFGKFNKEFPLHRQTGWRPYAKTYRLAIGITEVTCGVLLLLGKTIDVRLSSVIDVCSSAGILANLGEHCSDSGDDQWDRYFDEVELQRGIHRFVDLDLLFTRLPSGLGVTSKIGSSRRLQPTEKGLNPLSFV